MKIFDIVKACVTAQTSESTLENQYQEDLFVVVGTQYNLDNIKKLAIANSDWKKKKDELSQEGKIGSRIFRYSYINKPVKLIAEPQNPHDKNAIAVLIAGEKVGYISRDENSHVKNIISKHDVKFISSFISGGEYKITYENGNMEKANLDLNIKIKIGYK